MEWYIVRDSVSTSVADFLTSIVVVFFKPTLQPLTSGRFTAISFREATFYSDRRRYLL